MHLLTDLSASQPIAYAILILSLVALAGFGLGEVELRGIKLGVTGVLFAGILFGHFRVLCPLTPLTLCVPPLRCPARTRMTPTPISPGGWNVRAATQTGEPGSSVAPKSGWLAFLRSAFISSLLS
jgi:hypothetical protein